MISESNVGVAERGCVTVRIGNDGGGGALGFGRRPYVARVDCDSW